MKSLFYNGTILTMNDNTPIVNAMIIENNTILEVGDQNEITAHHQDVNTYIDLKGQTLLPGFNDSHMHLLGFGESLRLCRLEGTESIDALKIKLSDFADNNKDYWIRGRGWNQDSFKVKKLPTASDLDSVVPDKPVVLNRACGHILVCNSKALEIAGIHKNTPQPDGGHFDIDPTGHPTGILRENAMTLVQNHFPDPSVQSLKNAILAGSEYALSHGITSVQSDDLCVYPEHLSGRILDTFKEMDSNNELLIRVYEQALFRTPENLNAFIKNGFKTGRGSNFYKEGPLKILADGSLGARTALLSKGYEDEPDTLGISMYDQITLDTMVDTAQKNGLSTAIHAIGDGTIDMALEAMEKAQVNTPNTALRNSIVHCQITRFEHFDRMHRLNILAHIQPIFIDYDMQIVETRIGSERMKNTYAWKTMLKEGVRLAFGSDCPVEPLDIMPNIYSAVTRKNLRGFPKEGWIPEEKLDVLTVLKGFTIWPAYASCEEKIKGSIEPGKLADFVILDKNPLEIEPDDILYLNVMETWVDGIKVYEKK